MESNVCKIKKGELDLGSILTETEKVTKYNGLSAKETLDLRLLAEELVSMLPELVKDYEGEFVIKNEGLDYELQVKLLVDDMDMGKRESLIKMSSKSKNASAVGITGKIRAAFDWMVIGGSEASVVAPVGRCDFTSDLDFSYLWTLQEYKNSVREDDAEKWDELEKSIIAKLADNVVVGIKGRHVNIIIKKSFRRKAMKSNICAIEKGGLGLENILAEVEKVTAYNNLPKKEALRIRLLAEELTGMLPELVKNFEGVFWMQNNENKYELHVELSVAGLSKEKKASLLSVSASKKNAAASGFMGRIRDIAENMLLYSEEAGPSLSSYQYMYDYNIDLHYTYAWTLDNYTSKEYDNKHDNDEKWDELEKSIVAKLADDVIVGVRGGKVDIIIVKEF